jgi:hypothetical protein
LETSTRRSWLEKAIHYHEKAFEGFSTAVAQVTVQSWEAVYICSILMIVLAIAIPGLSVEDQNTNPVAEFVSLRRLMQGSLAILTTHHTPQDAHDILNAKQMPRGVTSLEILTNRPIAPTHINLHKYAILPLQIFILNVFFG